MRFPSYLVKNRFGVYYFQLVFPTNLRKIVNRKETRRSLKTSDRKVAVIMAQELRTIAERLFPLIAKGSMNWIETKTFLDDLAEKLFQKYVEKVNQVGFDFQDPNTLNAIMPAAEPFLCEPPSEPYPAYHFEIDKEQIKATYHKNEAVTGFVDSIPGEHKVDIAPDSESTKGSVNKP